MQTPNFRPFYIPLHPKHRYSVNYEMFIAKRLIKAQSGLGSLGKGTKIILGITISSISLGLAVMILAISIVTGFQNEIRKKVVGFGSHLHITEFNYSDPLNFKPIGLDQPFYPSLDTIKEVRTIQAYALKEGIIKTDDEIQGIIAKGIYKDFNWEFFLQNMVEGQALTWNEEEKSNEIIISREIATKLNIKLGESILIYFIQDGKSRPRKLTVTGIYHTGMKQFDEAYILMDMRHVQKLNNWREDQISGFEILLHDYKDLERMGEFLYHNIPVDLNTISIKDQHFEIFGWLELQDMNVIVIIVLLLLVCSVNVISVILILILEKTNFIGILKATGAQDWSIRKIFLYVGTFLSAIGILIGDLIGIGLALIQKYLKPLTLPQESYYIEFVPINLDLSQLLILNACTIALCIVVLLIPTVIIGNISPSKSIKFN